MFERADMFCDLGFAGLKASSALESQRLKELLGEEWITLILGKKISGCCCKIS